MIYNFSNYFLEVWTKISKSINFGFGPTFTLNRISGSPRVGFNTDYTISFRDKRVGINSLAAPGREIGLARVYDFSLESGSYNLNNLNDNSNRMPLVR